MKRRRTPAVPPVKPLVSAIPRWRKDPIHLPVCAQLQGRKIQAFTLLELLIAILIIVILASIALPLYFRSVEHARSTEALSNLSAIRSAQTLYRAQYGEFVEALDLPAINTNLNLELTARHYDYQIPEADQDSFLIVASSPRLTLTMDNTGKITYQWPGGGSGSSSGSTGASSGGGGSGGGSSGSGGAGSGGGGGSFGGGGAGTAGGGSSGGGSGTGGGSGGGSGGTDSGDSFPTLASGSTGTSRGTFPTQFPSATEPNIPDGPYAQQIRDAFNLLKNDGTLAQELAQLLILHQSKLTFSSLDEGTLGTIGPSSSWWDATIAGSQVLLDDSMASEAWPVVEIAAVLAHEAYHITQVYNDLFIGFPPTVLWLEDVEGPAYIRETKVWDSLRRDSSGTIVTFATHNDWDFRADSFIRSDGTVDEAQHNAYITFSRGITPNTSFF